MSLTSLGGTKTKARATKQSTVKTLITQAKSSAGGRPHAHLGTILDAAEAVVLRDGMGRLTLDAVAKQAGLSKAGLLHHLPSKDALIRAMVERNVTEWYDEFCSIYTKLVAAGETRPAVGTMMSTCLSGKQAWTEVERARNRVLIAALVHDERQIEPMRRVMRDIEGLIAKDILPPGVGDAIHLAVHGLWFQWIFGMGDVSHPRLTKIRGALSILGGFDRTPLVVINASGSVAGDANAGSTKRTKPASSTGFTSNQTQQAAKVASPHAAKQRKRGVS